MAREIICGIYKITNKINGKIYVGQSIDIHKRWREHKSDFKNRKDRHNIYFQRSWDKYKSINFEFEVIERCNKTELDIQERYWVKYYNSSDIQFGYNADEGSNGKVINKETKFRMGAGNRGIARNNQKIVQISLDGVLIRTWNNELEIRTEFIKETRSIRGCCRKEPKRYTAHGYIWIYEDEYLETGLDIDYYRRNKIVKEVLQFDLDMTFIKEWKSITEASKKLNIADWCISFCCNGKRKKASGFIWQYKYSQVAI